MAQPLGRGKCKSVKKEGGVLKASFVGGMDRRALKGSDGVGRQWK